MSAAIFGAVFLTGLLGGVHCAGMCGGIVAALSGQAGAGRWHLHLGYSLGRIASYASAGALAGAVGSLGLLLDGVLPVQIALYVLANLMLVAAGSVPGWGVRRRGEAGADRACACGGASSRSREGSCRPIRCHGRWAWACCGAGCRAGWSTASC